MSQQQTERDAPVGELAAAYVAAQSYRRAQLRIRAQYLREFLELWPLLGRRTPDEVARWLRLNVSLVERWQRPASALATEFYSTQHEAQVGGSTRVTPRQMDRAEIARPLASAALAVERRARLRGLDELEAEERAEAAAAGTGGRLVLEPGRQANVEKALGWMRVTDGDPCYFCAMLASRGAVYSSEQVALVSSKPDRLGREYHDECGCEALPIFVRSDFMSAEAIKYRDIWERTYGKTATTKAGREVTSVGYFRAVLEGRAELPN